MRTGFATRRRVTNDYRAMWAAEYETAVRTACSGRGSLVRAPFRTRLGPTFQNVVHLGLRSRLRSEGHGLTGAGFDMASSDCRYAADRVSLEILVVMLVSSPSRHCIRTARSSIAAGSMIQSFLAAKTWLSSPRQISKAGCWMARANENDNGQGSRDLNLTFMARSPGWPPDKNAIPRTASRYSSLTTLHRGVGYPSTAFCLGCQDHTLHQYPLCVKLVEKRSQDFLSYIKGALQGMLAIHEHFRFDGGR